MCGIWTQEEWREATGKGTYYHLVGEYQKGEQTALMVVEGKVEKPNFVWNVYSNDGKKTGLFVTDSNKGTAMEQATAAMKKQGFTPVLAQIAAAGEVPAEQPEPERVQGKTIEEWEAEGRLNEDREPREHVHPEKPENPTQLELKAYVVSLTTDEALFAALSMLSDLPIGDEVGVSA